MASTYWKSNDQPPQYYKPGYERYDTRYLQITGDKVKRIDVDDMSGVYKSYTGVSHAISLGDDLLTFSDGTVQHMYPNVNYVLITEREFLLVIGVL